MSQARSVSAEATHPNGTPSANSAAATDFARFERSVSALSGGNYYASGGASQNSAIGADRINVQMGSGAAISGFGGGSSRGTSTFDVTFDLTEPRHYELLANIGSRTFFTQLEVTFSGPDGEIFHFTGPTGGARGELAAGRYRLQATTTAVSGGANEFNSIALTIQLEVGDPPPPPPTRSYSLSGRFSAQRAMSLRLPQVGDVPCPEFTEHGCAAGTKQIKTTGTISRVGMPAHTLAVPSAVIAQPLPPSVHWTEPDDLSKTQIQTSFAFMNQQAVLRPNAWKQQAGRAAPDFTWCIGDPACTDLGAPGGPKALVKYSSGAARFGGTMKMLISVGPNPSRIAVRPGAPGVPSGPVNFVPVVANGFRATGAGYAFQQTDPAVSGTAYLMHVASSMGRVTKGTGPGAPVPGSTVMNYGFPFTTGQVIVRVARSPGAVTTISVNGGDEVTPMGVRNLSLVAGSLGVSQLGTPTSGIAQLALPEPGAFAQRLAGVAALLAIAARRARGRRRPSPA